MPEIGLGGEYTSDNGITDSSIVSTDSLYSRSSMYSARLKSYINVYTEQHIHGSVAKVEMPRVVV